MSERYTLTVSDWRHPHCRPLVAHAALTQAEASEIAAVYVALGYDPECLEIEAEKSEEAA